LPVLYIIRLAATAVSPAHVVLAAESVEVAAAVQLAGLPDPPRTAQLIQRTGRCPRAEKMSERHDLRPRLPLALFGQASRHLCAGAQGFSLPPQEDA
jgi:hypothetical protein